MQHYKKRVVFRNCCPEKNLQGKIDNKNYLNYFSAKLKHLGLDFVYIDYENYCLKENDIIVNIIQEDKNPLASYPDDIATFNQFNTAAILSDKEKTIELYNTSMIPSPKKCNWTDCDACLSFSKTGSGKKVKIIQKYYNLDPNRHNVEFIDTRRSFKGKLYHTSLRILAIGGQIVDIWLRFRPAEEPPIVHSKNTPLDSELLNFFYDSIIIDHHSELEQIASNLHYILGPGFYVHDLLVDTNNNFFVCESGFKFDDETYRKHIIPVVSKINYNLNILNPKNLAEKSADLLVQYLQQEKYL